jgi:hypothetical protein
MWCWISALIGLPLSILVFILQIIAAQSNQGKF